MSRMLNFLLRRLGFAALTVVIVVILSGFLIHLVPGDPVTTMIAQSSGASDEAIADMRSRLGLDLPIWQQVLRYGWNALHGDLGVTIRGGEPVSELLLDRLPNTFALAVSGLLVALLIGVPMGVAAAVYRGGLIDSLTMIVAVLGVSIPGFWLGLLLIQIFAENLAWLPVAGSGPKNLILPALTLGLSYSAMVARMTRSSMVDILEEDYIRTARARGLHGWQVLFIHALRPALINIVTVIGLVMAYLMGGQVIIENVFSWNGIGRLAVQAMLQRDYPMIQGFIVVFATSVVLISMLIDVFSVVLDPRQRAA